MSGPVRKRGRPTLAAQSIDDALHAAHQGKAPARPRNAFERAAHTPGKRGRKVVTASPTQQAAALAVYLQQYEGVSKAEAARRAATQWGVNADNVRRYARGLLAAPMVTIRYSGPSLFPVAPQEMPLVVFIGDSPPDDF